LLVRPLRREELGEFHAGGRSYPAEEHRSWLEARRWLGGRISDRLLAPMPIG
jgi:hypothetical protein